MKRPSFRSLAPGGLVLALGASCIDDNQSSLTIFIDPLGTHCSIEQRGDDSILRVKVSVSLQTFDPGIIHVDSASVVTQVGGQQAVFSDPDVVAPEFPVEDAAESLPLDLTGFPSTSLTLEIASPIGDPDEFEAYCVAAGRTVDVTVNFYATQNDRRKADEPPLVSGTVTAPLALSGPAPAPEVFSTFDLFAIPSGSLVAPPVPTLSPGHGNDVYFVVEKALLDGSTGQFTVFQSDPDSVALVIESNGEFVELPRVASRADGGLYLGGRGSNNTISISAIDAENSTLSYVTIPASVESFPQYDAFRLAQLSRSTNGLHAVVQSAFGVDDPVSSLVLSPPEGKYYGAFLYELGDDLSLLSVEAFDRDILSIELLPDGGTLLSTAELPPRTESATISVERFDIAGELVWSFEEPADTSKASVRPLPDGGAIIAYESGEPSTRIDVVRLAGEDGSELYRYTALGSDASIAANADGSVFVSFVGVDGALDLPERAVPVLIELSASGEVVRAAQVACGGTAALTTTEDGDVMMIGSFLERASLGDRVVEIVAGEFAVGSIF